MPLHEISSVDLAVGQELAYTEFTSNVAVNTGNADIPNSVVSSGAIVYSGARICIEFYAAIVEPASGGFISITLWDDATRLGDFTSVALTTTRNVPVFARRFITPTAGSHTYKVMAWRGTTNGTIYAGTGASATYMPGYIRITET